MYTQKTANIFDHIQDYSRLGLENKFLENKSRQIFLRSTGLPYKFLPTNLGCLNQPFIIFIHHIWGETVLFIIQTSERIRYFTIFQDKLHSVNFQADHSWALSETVQKFPKSPIRPAGSRFYSASCQCRRVFEWTLIELRFNIIASLLLFFLLVNGFSYNDV